MRVVELWDGTREHRKASLSTEEHALVFAMLREESWLARTCAERWRGEQSGR